jgi:hypothetical protein
MAILLLPLRRRLHRLAILLTALALVPAGAHLAELPAKLALGREEYLLVQGLYRGWAWFGAVIIAALVAHLALAITLGRRGGRALVAAGLLGLGLAVFFVWIFPLNQATAQWTRLPESGWEALRETWEYAHAANAVLTFGALCLAVLSLPLSPAPEPE